MFLGPGMPPIGSPEGEILAIDIVSQKRLNSIIYYEIWLFLGPRNHA